MKVLSTLFIAGVLVGLRQLPRLWTHRTTYYDKPGVWWPYTVAAWRAWVRGMPAGALAAALMGTAAVIGAFTGKFDADAPRETFANHTASGLTMLVLVGMGLLLFLLALMATYLNRPKWLVPPHLRDGPGLIAEWRRDRDT